MVQTIMDIVSRWSSVLKTSQSAVDADVITLAGSGCRRTITNVWPGLVGESERLLTRANQRNGCRGTSNHRKETHHHVLNTRLHASIVCRWHHSPDTKGFHSEANFFSSSASNIQDLKSGY